eukprot:TRINITY_DN33906_c0_g1_i1.p1 TRINITY_DN33906_c0_g1~~TRINITY_DN33906_c0_g1_i1.p1  ORF type:complete len:104 (+),score=9.12 TRINITY_DN33906_c0_g1_i1:101-412(+)
MPMAMIASVSSKCWQPACRHTLLFMVAPTSCADTFSVCCIRAVIVEGCVGLRGCEANGAGTEFWAAEPPTNEMGKIPVSYTHLRAHETPEHLVCRLLLEKKKE